MGTHAVYGLPWLFYICIPFVKLLNYKSYVYDAILR
jgi:hypothetical protein